MSAKIITITSGKGGVGKTTATANISVALAMRGQRVVAIDEFETNAELPIRMLLKEAAVVAST